MPLLDHFHPPVSTRRGWASIHAAWSVEIMARLNEHVLGAGFFAETEVRLGHSFEVDVATLTGREDEPISSNGSYGHGGGTAVATAPAWSPPAVELEAETVFPDEFEVQVFRTRDGKVLVGAIELVSPANKDRPESRRAFAGKVAAYLSRKVGVVVVDVVTDHHFNLHDDVCDLLGLGPPFPFDPDPGVYAVAYRPVRRDVGDRIQMWRRPLAVGGGLPVIPLGLRDAGVVPVDLETTYADACRRSRLPTGGAA